MNQNKKKMKNKVLLCFPDFSGGGAERVMLTLLNSLVRKEVTKCLVMREDGPLRDMAPPQCDIVNLECKSARKAVIAMAFAFRKEKPDIVMSTMAYFNFTVIIGLILSGHKPKKVVLREANTPSSTLSYLPLSGIFKVLYRCLYQRADVIICNSKEVKNELLLLKIDCKKIVLIPNPIHVADVRKRATEKVNLPKFRNPELPFFVSIGRLCRQKGFDRLISWFNQSEVQANLLIIGDGPEAGNLITLRDKVGLRGQILFLNFQQNPFPFIAQAEALLISSRWEGQPNVGLESIALGTKVIASSTSGGLLDLIGLVPNEMLVVADSKEQFIAALIASAKPAKKETDFLPSSCLPGNFYHEKVLKEYKLALGIAAI